MSIKLGATFDKTPSINYDALQTFDTSIEDDEQVQITFSSISADKHPAIAFTQSLFEARPELFGPYAMSLIYAQHSGTSYKAEVIYTMFESYIKYGPSAIVNLMKTRPLSTYELCPNYLILWAKILRNTRMTITFEPVMTKLNTALNNFFQNKKITIKGITYDISIFKPLCYTRTGECYFALLPYIAYLITFFVDCRPYAFNEAHTESSSFGFYTSLNNYFQKHYTAFFEDTDIDLVKSDPRKLPASLTDKHIAEMMHAMLHPDKIIKLRNDEISKTPELLQECIKDQASLTSDFVETAFKATLSKLLRIIFQQNPIRHIFDAIPHFKNEDVVNNAELSNWTSYCLAGGDKPYIIESGVHTASKGIKPDYSNVLHIDPSKLLPYPDVICGKQGIPTAVAQLTISKLMPFCENDIILNMCTAYVRQKFDAKMNDILSDDTITVNEPMLWNDKLYNKPLSVILKDNFLNGIWSYDNSSLAKILDQLCMIPEFVSEIVDMVSLCNVTQLVYKNQLASTIIGTYLLSFLNDWILDAVSHGHDLRLFRPYRYFVRASADMGRIGKLCDMAVSLLYLATPDYVKLVNSAMKEFMTIMDQAPLILQPYVKHLNDLADIYAIGGCELYRWATHANPIVRGCMWHYNVFGSSEELETFYRWILKLDNAALMELLEGSINDTVTIDSTLKTQLLKVLEANKQPLMLCNYDFDSSLGYKEKKNVYVMTLKNSLDIGVLNAVVKRVFQRSRANMATSASVWFKRIMFKNGEVVARKAFKNSMDVNDKLLPATISDGGLPLRMPIYDTVGSVDDVKVIHTAPAGHRLINLTLSNSRNDVNQTIMLYTRVGARTRFSVA